MRQKSDPLPALSSALLRAGLKNAGIALFFQDPSQRYLWAENYPEYWFPGSILGLTDADIFPPENIAAITVAKKRVIASGQQAALELRLQWSTSDEWFQFWFDPAFSTSGEFTGLLTTASRITDQKHKEQALNALLREVSHRSKNLLAIIQSIAAQTGRYSENIGDFLGRFRGRILSLSSSQDLVTSSNWRGAGLAQLVSGQVGRYCADPARNIEMTGMNPYLTPNAALYVGLALHELAVNSVSYGTLSADDGIVRIGVSMIEEQAQGGMTLKWSEDFQADPSGERPKRFGSVALERIVPASIGSTASLDFVDGELLYSLRLPPDCYQASRDHG